MEIEELQEQILAYVKRPGYQPVKPAVIAKKLNLPKTKPVLQAFKRALKRLLKKGELHFGPSHLLLRPFDTGAAQKKRTTPDNENLVVGTFRRNPAGYGFVRPKGMTQPGDRSADIFIPATKTRDAANGDVVAVRISRENRRKDRGPAGEITEIVEREKNRFVGRYFADGDLGLVEVDGNVFPQPIDVGDAGAKNVREGDTVVLEMVRYPTHAHPGEGVIVEVLGPRGAPGVDTLSIIHEFDLPGEFPEEVLADAREQATKFDESLEGRLDLTGLTILTIDPVDARDFDDAISLERLEGGHWRLGVHIADVSHFVPEGSALDTEAKERSTSCYLPDRVIPMLPEIISNNLASLQPNKVRYTQTAFLEYTEDGKFVACDTHRSAIKSQRRFTYEEVDDFLANREKWREKLTPPVFDLLGRMHELAMILRRRRMERGALELVLPEVKIDLDKDGKVCGAHVVDYTESHQIIEEFMLAANIAVAEKLAAANLPFLRRLHDNPSQRRMQTLTTFVRELGFPAENLENRFELQDLLKTLHGRPEERAVNYAVLRSMQKAVYGPQEGGHYALASDTYCHFTSPIRRYPDLTIHRMLDEINHGQKPAADAGAQTTLGEHCSEREQRAEAAERELIKVKLLNFLTKKLGSQMDAVITGVEDFGIFAQGIELPAEGFIHISALHEDHYDYDSHTHTLVGRRRGNRYRLGDTIRVEITHIDVGRRQLDFRVVQRLANAPAPPSLLVQEGEKKSRGGKKTHRNKAGYSAGHIHGEKRGKRKEQTRMDAPGRRGAKKGKKKRRERE